MQADGREGRGWETVVGCRPTEGKGDTGETVVGCRTTEGKAVVGSRTSEGKGDTGETIVGCRPTERKGEVGGGGRGSATIERVWPNVVAKHSIDVALAYA